MLQVFKLFPVARAVYREETLPPAARGYGRDTITLGWEARLKARGRCRSDGGVEFGTALARGTVLRGGDCVVLDQPAVTIAVVEREEPVFVIEPRSGSEWARYAYYIGNSHQPVMITDRAILCPDVPGMEQVLQYHDIPFTRAVQSFTPVGLLEGFETGGHRHQP